MLKLTKKQYIKLLLIYTWLALAAVFCYNFKKIMGAPRKRPFQCNDENLSKPFILMDTVPPKQLYILGVYFPIALIASCELFCCWTAKSSLHSSRWILKYVLKSSVVLTLFFIGLSVERLFKNMGKLKMARLRPNFITVCEPMNADGYTCQELDNTVVMEDYHCSSDSYPSWAVNSAFVSFPSGHTSLTAYSMLFIVGYLHLLCARLKHEKIFSTLLVLIVQIWCLLMILFVGASRVLDYRHHWTDVFAGFLAGSSVAVILCWYLKGQQDNIDMWLKDVINAEEIKRNPKAAHVTSEDKEASFAIELGGV
ncbi:putative phosphatidate phosphatase [Lucilia cuprina]|uniref:putative phosphatidate phosphatase n=1 Tax=Lucilia cuprina TaxID=7375 RepID=UPI001F05ADDB|nr:putative phosphatidate phosphatase [Lucilia cuprina]